MSYRTSYPSNVVSANSELFRSGLRKIAWAKHHMPILNQLIAEYRSISPLAGHFIVTSVHLEAKTAYLVQALATLGATVFATGCNPLSTQDDVAVALAATPHVSVHAKHGCDESTYWDFLHSALSYRPHIIIDDGGDLVKIIQQDNTCSNRLIGGCEETTTGIHRLKALAKNGELKFPMINVNDANCKHLFDNHYGTGQSVTDGILRTTNLIVAGKTVVVAGYGDCGSGIALRMRGLDAKVIVTEIDPIKALKAHMDGYTVMNMDEAAKHGDIFITATGCKDVITRRHFRVMKNGAILANAGHFNVEIDLSELEHLSKDSFEARHNVQGYTLGNDKVIYTIAEGRLVNLAAADGHAAEIMDMSFSIQLLSVIEIAKHWNNSTGYRTPPGVYSVSKEVDDKVADIALKTQGITIDTLTETQREYLENGF